MAVRRSEPGAVVVDDQHPDRVHDQKPYHSGKHRRHGMNVQVIADAAGRLVWASAALPGSAHDLTAARTHGIIAALTNADVMIDEAEMALKTDTTALDYFNHLIGLHADYAGQLILWAGAGAQYGVRERPAEDRSKIVASAWL